MAHPAAAQSADLDALRAQLYRRMLTIRRTEEALARVFERGLSFGTVHLCIGQEAVPAGVLSLLGDSDVVTSTHRGHGHYLSRTDDVEGLVAEVLGKATGVCGGWGGSQHLHAPGFYSNGITGGMTPVAAGMALAEQELRTGGVVVAFMGDGALGQGVAYESWNLAALWKLPVVYVIEDNGYAMSTAVRNAVAGPYDDRPAAFGLNVVHVDGQDVEAVRAAAEPILDAARRGEGAGVVFAKTYRLCGHSKSDKRAYRTRAEEAQWAHRDPVELLAGHLEGAVRAAIEAEVTARVQAAVQAAIDAPFPKLAPGQVERLQAYPETAGHDGPQDAGAQAAAEGAPDPGVTYQIAIREALAEAVQADPRVLVWGEDIEDPYGGAFKVTQGLSERLPGRLRNTPLSEAVIMGSAGGAALRGLRPVVEIMFSDFLTLTADQLINHIAKFRTMWGGRTTTPLVVRTAGGGWRGYGATHSQAMERLPLTAPGLTVVCPSLHHDVGACLHAAIAHDGPVIFVEQKLFYAKALVRPAHVRARGWRRWVGGGAQFPSVHLSNVDRGLADVAIVTYGAAAQQVIRALEALGDDVRWELVLPSLIRPLPLQTLVRAALRCERMVVVEEGPRPWGWGAEVAARVTEVAFEALAAPVIRVAGADLPLANTRNIEDALLPKPSDVINALLEVLE